MIMTELEHAWFKNLILVTDRGYESMKNLETYIAKGQKIITSVKVGGAEVLKLIRGIDTSRGYPKGMTMTLARKGKVYYAQYDADYSVKGNGEHIVDAEKYKINIYYNPMKRAEAICDIQHAIDEQKEAADKLIASKEAVADCDDIRRSFNMLTISFNEDNSVASYEVNSEKADNMLLTAGFFASKTIGIDIDPLQAKTSYGMRD